MATRIYKDIDLNFIPHPSTGDLMVKSNAEAIKNSVKNLIMTKHYERPFHSEIGSSVSGLLFEIANPGHTSILRQEIIDTITNFEPRVELISIDITPESPDYLAVIITITFKIKNTVAPIKLEFALTRTR